MNNIKLSYQPSIYMTVGLKNSFKSLIMMIIKNEEILGQVRGKHFKRIFPWFVVVETGNTSYIVHFVVAHW